MPYNAEGTHYPTDYAVICQGHEGAVFDLTCGTVPLSSEQYMDQLFKPDHGWQCPRCGAPAQWDDDCPATNPLEDIVFEDFDDIEPFVNGPDTAF